MSAFVQLQRLLPQHALSRLLGRFANSPLLSRPLIQAFSAAYGVSLRRSASAVASTSITTFNDFFTRSLAPGTRPLPDDRTRARVTGGRHGESTRHDRAAGDCCRRKASAIRSTSFVLDSRAEKTFDGGWFATIYLAPSDYHRVHVPIDGTLVRSVAVPGELFSVNAKTEAGVDRLFCRNERLVMHFDSGHRSVRPGDGRRADRREHRNGVRRAAVAVSQRRCRTRTIGRSRAATRSGAFCSAPP